MKSDFVSRSFEISAFLQVEGAESPRKKKRRTDMEIITASAFVLLIIGFVIILRPHPGAAAETENDLPAER